MYERILAGHALTDGDIAYMGDDVVYSGLLEPGRSGDGAGRLRRGGFRTRAHWITTVPGGSGAAREVIERIVRLRASGRRLSTPYLNQPADAADTHRR